MMKIFYIFIALVCYMSVKVYAENFPLSESFESNFDKWTVSDSTQLERYETSSAKDGNLVMRRKTYSTTFFYLTLKDSLKLNTSNVTNPVISFWARSQDGNSFYLGIEISTNNGESWGYLLSDWIVSNLTSTSWVRYQCSLENYKISNLKLRFKFYNYPGWIDKITIDNAPMPQTILATSMTDHGGTIKFKQSTASDFYKYRVVVSNSSSVLGFPSEDSSYSMTANVEKFVYTSSTKTDTSKVFSIANGNPFTFPGNYYYAKVYEIDSQELVNQGSETTQFQTTFTCDNNTAPKTENFDGSTEPVWAAYLPWKITNSADGETGHSSPKSFESNPGGIYARNTTSYLYSKWTIPTSVTKPVLKFNHKFKFSANDYGQIYIYNGSVSRYLTYFTGNQDEWIPQEFCLNELKNTDPSTPIWIYFILASNDDDTRNAGWNLDDIAIVQNTRSNITFPFTDDCEQDSNFKKNFFPGRFERYNTGSAHSGEWVIRRTANINPATWEYLTLGAPISLSSKPNPYLSFWYKGLGTYANSIGVEISSDGGINWTDLVSPFGVPNTSWNRFQASLANYKVSNVMIRIKTYDSQNYGLWIDDIMIDNAPTPQTLQLLNPTNNGVTVRWKQSTASDFAAYRIVISTDQNNLGYTSTENSSSVSNRTENIVFTVTSKADTNKVLSPDTFDGLTFTGGMYYYGKVYEIDSQGFNNQGTETAQFQTTWVIDSNTVPKTETFDGTPTPNWAADLPWKITNNADGEDGHSSPKSFESNPDAFYAKYANRWLYSKWKIPSSITRPVLKLNHKFRFSSGDYGCIYFYNSSSSFSYNYFTGNQDEWIPIEINLSEMKKADPSTPVYAYFYVNDNNDGTQNMGWNLDDIGIIQNPRTDLSFPFADNCEQDSNFKKNFIPGRFERYNTGSAHSGEWVYRRTSNTKLDTWEYLTFGTPINLVGKANPYLSFWYKGLGTYGNSIGVEISSDGGINWTDLVSPFGVPNTSWNRFQASLANYKVSNVMIRIKTYDSQNYGCWLDDIVIGSAPTLLSPINNSTNQSRNNLEFTWSGATNSSQYKYQLSKVSNFASLVKDSTLTASTITIPTLDSNTIYYWRVMGLTEDTDWTETWNFKTTTTTPGIYSPALVSPAYNATGLDTFLTFKWRKVDYATKYKFQLSLGYSFSAPLINETLTADTALAVNSLSNGTTYYWRVQSLNNTDTSTYTYPSVFATKGNGGGSTYPAKNVKVKVILNGLWASDKHLPTGVSIELRSGSALVGSVVSKRIAASIDTLGYAESDFGELADGSYWLVVRASGYLPVANPSQISLSTSGVDYDFTTGSDKSVAGTNAMIQPGGAGPWMIRAGDFNNSRSITAADINSYFLPSNGKNVSSQIPAP